MRLIKLLCTIKCRQVEALLVGASREIRECDLMVRISNSNGLSGALHWGAQQEVVISIGAVIVQELPDLYVVDRKS